MSDGCDLYFEMMKRHRSPQSALIEATNRLAAQQAVIDRQEKTIDLLFTKLVEHHAAGLVQGTLVGDQCAICAEVEAAAASTGKTE